MARGVVRSKQDLQTNQSAENFYVPASQPASQPAREGRQTGWADCSQAGASELCQHNWTTAGTPTPR